MDLEKDIFAAPWLMSKICDSRVYAQNFYAALCNNDFSRKDMWCILRGDTWGCSWRYAGGLVARIRNEGDYMDWYCSGIGDHYISDDDVAVMTPHQKELNAEAANYVREAYITDEIREDLDRLGWMAVTVDTDE